MRSSLNSAAASLFFVLLTVAGCDCGNDPPLVPPCESDTPPPSCGQTCDVDASCADGTYCGPEGTCTADCTASGGECGAGQTCDARGRCVSGPADGGTDGDVPADGDVPVDGGTDGTVCQTSCEADDCGSFSNGCGGSLDCPACPSNQACGIYEAHKCGVPACEPTPTATACAGKCGEVNDGCGGVYVCDGSNGGVTCTGQNYCGALAPNQCGNPSTCEPQTCAQLGHSCGLAADGCGQVLNCWPQGTSQCPDPQTQGCVANAVTGAQSCVSGTTGCTGPLCSSVPTCPANSPTRLTGTIRTPGRNVGNNTFIGRVPVPNAIVYIPADPSAALPTIPSGVNPGDPLSCARCADEKLVADGQTVLAAAVTDYRGQFTLEGRIPVGVPFNIVIKAGKWRRVVQVPGSVANACASAALASTYTYLAANSSDGLAGTQLPKIAISTGDVDEMECVLYNLGISSSEFTRPSGNGRLHMYRGNGARMTGASYTCTGTFSNNGTTTQCSSNSNFGCNNQRTGCSWNDNSRALYQYPSRLNSYDLVIFDCEGAENADYPGYAANVRSYVDNGGRFFASHWAYNWITSDTSLAMSAAWNTTGSTSSDVGYISMPSGNTARTRANPVKSVLFRNWLDWQGALTNTTAGVLNTPATPRFGITDARDLAGATVGAGSDEWVYRTTNSTESATGTVRVQQLSFNTPYNAAENAICGRVAYSGFHVADAPSNNDESFPAVCGSSALTTQELILAFMLFDLSTCVSAGDPPAPPTCTPKTVQDLCPNVNDACGFLPDGCGGVVDCAGCSASNYCNGNQCTPITCMAATCGTRGADCGFERDGCGGVLDCGACANNQVCVNGMCQMGTCTPMTQPMACQAAGTVCGQAPNGCGGLVDCGVCPGGTVCTHGQCVPVIE